MQIQQSDSETAKLCTSFNKDFQAFLLSILCSHKERRNPVVICGLQVANINKYTHNFAVTLKE